MLTMDDQTRLLDVIGRLYDAVTDEAQWLPAMQGVSEFVGGTGVYHVVLAAQSGEVIASESAGIDPLGFQLYQSHYAAMDVRLPAALDRAVGEVVTEQMLLERRAFERSQIYAELLKPYDVPHILATTLQRNSDHLQAVVIQAGVRHGPFDATALDRLRDLVPHLIRAARLRDALRVEHARTLEMSALDRLPVGVVFLERGGQIVAVNRFAERLLHHAGGLCARQARLRAACPLDDRVLERAISTCRDEGSTERGATLRIRRRPPASPLSITLIPLRRSTAPVLYGQASVLGLIRDPDCCPRLAPRIIEVGLNLTAAESRLACQLLDGLSVAECARQLGKSVYTCRAQLKSIYAKSGCRTQAALMRKLLLTLWPNGAP